jgi:uncharacterized membrane protein YqhA
MAETPGSPNDVLDRIESSFETALWKFRLIALLPVVMTAITSLTTFMLGTKETIHSIKLVLHDFDTEIFPVAEVLGEFVGGVDLYLVGIALLIFSYGTYELLISDVSPGRKGNGTSFKGVLDVKSLDDLKEKLVKVLVVALLVVAFKSMIALPIPDRLSLLYYSLTLLLLTFCAFLLSKLGHGKS